MPEGSFRKPTRRQNPYQLISFLFSKWVFVARVNQSAAPNSCKRKSLFAAFFPWFFLHRNYASLCDTLTRMEGLITNNSASRAVSWPTFNFLYFDNFRDVWEFIFQPCLNVLQPNFPLKCISLQKLPVRCKRNWIEGTWSSQNISWIRVLISLSLI